MDARRERVNMDRAMWRDAATSRLMYRLNLAGASVQAGLSLMLSSTYELYLPHRVGHLFPAASVVVAALWGALCVLLCLTDLRLRTRADLAAVLLPFALAAVSAWVCQMRYVQQL
ncbi:hypothetical protein [Lysobacter enzymogenes]|uniref:hypothetical protein n=1 Tax=Lysobacter enzymogenes TaxID=69 RepID=UPI001A96B141|nr:hypothetical protein [Lysobacter enzymogenes]QQP96642.1 hypothetical protein JHW38_00865 [Lysobacter enzymogenes]